MKSYSYKPSNPFSGKITNLAIAIGMIVVPLVVPFGIRIGRLKILGPTPTAIIFVAGGALLLLFTLLEIRKAKAIIDAGGGRITVEEGKVTIPVIRKGSLAEETFAVDQVKRTKFDDEEKEFEIDLGEGVSHTLQSNYFESDELFEEFRSIFAGKE